MCRINHMIKVWSLAVLICSQSFCVAEQVSKRDKAEQLIQHVKLSIENADQQVSKLSGQELSIEGMSSSKGRHLLNNLCTLPNASYLEIGVWLGSTWIAALSQNESTLIQAVGIDNWALFGGPKETFENNCKQFLPNSSYDFYSVDCFAVNTSDIIKKPINIYFYDGEHTALDQELALTYYNDVLDDVFILVIDDWIFPSVLEGTYTAFAKLNYKILWEQNLRSNDYKDSVNWWNGMYIAVIEK